MGKLKKPKNMATISRLGVYLLIFLVSIILIASITNFWKSLDYYVYKTFYLDDTSSVVLKEKMSLIDLPYHAEDSETFDKGNYRKRLINLLDTIGAQYDANKRPKAVILDIFFTNDKEELEPLDLALKRLKTKGVKVYGVYDMRDYEKKYFENHDAKQARQFYENYFEGFRLHTEFQERLGVLSYSSELKFPTESGGYQFVEALTVKVARDILDESTPLESRDYILPIGTKSNVDAHTITFKHEPGQIGGGTFSKPLNMNDQILIVGSLEEDQLVPINQTGTHLVTWALLDQLNHNQLAKQPLDSIPVIIGLIIFFGLFTVLVFALLFKYVKSLQTKPLVIAILSFVISSVLLMLLGLGILATGKVLPVGLTLISILVAAVLAWRFAYKFLVTGVAEGSEKNDVFISYSHGNSEWVKKNVLEPLESATINGKKLKIFFDEKSIGIGEPFTAKYMWEIVDSKVFIPIISEEYYGKNHCKNEMDLAVKRSVEELIRLMPIVFSYDCVPEAFQHINFTDITVNPNFIEAIKEELAKEI
ncbi:toll/interleukin-1 receptor domain-containing protein [Lacinutrix iliipiscaria]|uniref:Toll/interleukin-1 receptor domain-containing protein n=1 Tax=Lacinutrix iliipiscaria TaxID=1230532 RepID=A0ABW5WK71_9FLAO